MKKMCFLKRLSAFALSVILIVSACFISAFAQDYSFTYYYANDAMTQVYISGFQGDVPDNGFIVIPDTVNGCTVVGITANAFANLTGVQGVVIPYTTTYIDANAFANSGNISVLYPDQYEDYKNSFDSENWNDNTAQDYVISGNTLIGYRGTDKVITIPEFCTAVADGVFKNKKDITTVYIHSNLESIGASAFENCKNLETVIIDRGMGSVEIGANAFKNTPWLDSYESNFVIIGTTLVKYKGDENKVSIPNVLTSVADGAFYNTSVTAIKVPVTIKLFGGAECFMLSETKKTTPEITAYKDSFAEKYCKDNNIEYIAAPRPGDIDNNGKITPADARYVLRATANLANPDISEISTDTADISGDNIITPSDARHILRIAAGLSAYSVDDLLTMPRSSHEVLLAVTDAVAHANAYNSGYTKFAYQEISASDMNTRTARNLKMFENELTSADKAVTTVYPRNSEGAKANFFDISLVNSDRIKSYTSVIDDEYYIYTITLKDEKAFPDNAYYTQQMFPVEEASHFEDRLSEKLWVDNFNWNMTYTDCTVEMKVEINSGRLSYVILTMNYDFEMSGKTGTAAVTNADGSSSTATATRTDVIRYTNFSYYE